MNGSPLADSAHGPAQEKRDTSETRADNRVHVALVADEAYMSGLRATRESIVRSCRSPERLVFHTFSERPELTARMRREFGEYKGSPMTFLRLYLADLLPDLDAIIYTDVDTLWNRDICELWDATVPRTFAANPAPVICWARDLPGSAEDYILTARATGIPPIRDVRAKYACAGVCVINLKAWRATRVLDRCRDFIRRYGTPKYADQDVLNYVLQNEAVLFPRCWDVLIPDPENTRGGCVLHLTGVSRCFNKPYAGRILQYRYWEHVARGRPFHPGSFLALLPFRLFYVPRGLIRFCLPWVSDAFVDRLQRFWAYRWYFARHA